MKLSKIILSAILFVGILVLLFGLWFFFFPNEINAPVLGE